MRRRKTKRLYRSAEKIATILERHDLDTALEISWELIDKVSNLAIVLSPSENYAPPHKAKNERTPCFLFFRRSRAVPKYIKKGETKKKVLIFHRGEMGKDPLQLFILGFLKYENGK